MHEQCYKVWQEIFYSFRINKFVQIIYCKMKSFFLPNKNLLISTLCLVGLRPEDLNFSTKGLFFIKHLIVIIYRILIKKQVIVNFYNETKNSYTYEDLINCGDGELFGKGNAKLPLPPMLMFDRITEIQKKIQVNTKRDI